jgi:hypothetical protein
MNKNTKIWLAIGGVVLVGGVLFFVYRKPKSQENLLEENPENVPPSELPKIDLTKIFQKSDKKKAQEDKYALMKRLELPQSVIDATKKADEKSRFNTMKHPTINVGGLNIPTTNANMDSINRLNPSKLSSSVAYKPTIFGGLGSVK